MAQSTATPVGMASICNAADPFKRPFDAWQGLSEQALFGCLTSVGPSSFRSLVLQASLSWLAPRAQPHRYLRVSSTNFVPPPSPIRMQLPANIGFRHWQLAHPLHTPYGASLSFVRFTHLRLLPHSPSRASQRLASLWSSRGPPQHCTCLLGVGFPLPGPQVWICTSCLLNMPDTLLRLAGTSPRRCRALPDRHCAAPSGAFNCDF